jgi:hypothetical protein
MGRPKHSLAADGACAELGVLLMSVAADPFARHSPFCRLQGGRVSAANVLKSMAAAADQIRKAGGAGSTTGGSEAFGTPVHALRTPFT